MKILCIPYTHTLSHISRPLLVAMELRKRGHEVAFAGESPRKSFIEQEGFPVLPLHEPDPEELYGNIRSGKLRFVSDDEINQMLEADLALYRQVKPDLVLTDGRFTAPISTHIAGIRHAAIVNVSSTEYRALPYIPFFDWVPDWLVSRNSLIWKGFDNFNLWLEMLVFDRAMDTFAKLSRIHSLPRTITATNCLVGKDYTLLADIPEYFPTRSLPGDYCYIGPLTWKSAISPPGWWPPRKNGKPLIYLSMGTTGLSDFFHTVAELVQSSEMLAIVTTGGQTSGIESVDGRLYVESFLDGDLVMEECDVVICHGGNGTIYQALSHGKPVIGIPTIPDQKFNMRRVEALGVGRTISWDEFIRRPEVLFGVIQSVLQESSFQESAIRLKKIIETYTPAETAANLIEKAGVVHDGRK